MRKEVKQVREPDCNKECEDPTYIGPACPYDKWKRGVGRYCCYNTDEALGVEEDMIPDDAELIGEEYYANLGDE